MRKFGWLLVAVFCCLVVGPGMAMAYPSSTKVVSDIKGTYQKGYNVTVKVTGTKWDPGWSSSDRRTISKNTLASRLNLSTNDSNFQTLTGIIARNPDWDDLIINDDVIEALENGVLDDFVEKLYFDGVLSQSQGAALKKLLNYPPDECRMWVQVTHPKAKDGSYKVSEGNAVYYRPIGSSSENWKFREFYVHNSAVKGVAQPSKAELVQLAVATLKAAPQNWFYSPGKIVHIYEITCADPLEFEQISSDKMQYKVVVKYDFARGDSLDTRKHTQTVELVKKGNQWTSGTGTIFSDPFEQTERMVGRAQIAAMKNLQDNGFDAVYSGGQAQ
ncbi:MAG: hypothetical protein WC636_00795 [Candidatus Margulisiibacteriota bacterium]